jgi:LmbE family N-acetylglucosaminyl deacetylase
MENLNGTERVMVISPHPDDVDFGCSGTIAKWSRRGVDITYVICTSGDKGTDLPSDPRELTEIREKEQLAATEIVGVSRSKVVFLRLKDGELENNREFRKTLVRVLRQHRPDVVLTMGPANVSFENMYVSHVDHRAAALAAFDAIYPAARNRNFFPELLDEGLEPHAVSRVFFFGTAHPNTWIDISETIEIKIAALQAHQSQVGAFEDLSGWIRKRWGQFGQEKGFAYAEPFRYLVTT